MSPIVISTKILVL